MNAPLSHALAALRRWVHYIDLAEKNHDEAMLRRGIVSLGELLKRDVMLRHEFEAALSRSASTDVAVRLHAELSSTARQLPGAVPATEEQARLSNEQVDAIAQDVAMAFRDWEPQWSDGRCEPPCDAIRVLPDRIKALLNEQTDPTLPALEILTLCFYIGFFRHSKPADLLRKASPHDWTPFRFDLVRHCVHEAAHYLETGLLSGHSVHTALLRFRAFVEWYARDRVMALMGTSEPQNTKLSERSLHQFLNEFLFNLGLLPTVNPSIMENEPDTLLPVPRLDGTETVLAIEVKQFVSRAYSASEKPHVGRAPRPAELEAAAAQCINYARTLQAAGHRCEHAAVVCFYGGERPIPSIEPSWVQLDRLHLSVVAVYLGSGRASRSGPVVRWTPPTLDSQ